MKALTSSLVLLVIAASSAFAPVGTSAARLPRAARALADGAQSLTVPDDLPAAFEVDLLIDGELARLRLAAHSLRAPEFRMVVADGAGVLRSAAPPAPTTYRGEIAGRPGSSAAAFLSRAGLHALILDGQDAWALEPAAGPARRDLHTVARIADLWREPMACGVVGGPPDESRAFDPPSTADGSGLASTEIALDLDSVFVADFEGDPQAALAAAEGFVAGSSLIYEYFLGIQYAMSGVVIRTAANDPYLAAGLDQTTSAFVWRTAFKSEWQANFPQSVIPRDVAYLISGYGGMGNFVGAAKIGGVCVGDHYAVGINAWTYHLNLQLLSHELGHLWSACHCDDVQCPSGYDPTDCGIMDSGVGAATLFFGAKSTAQILAYKATRTCLDPGSPTPAPTLVAVAPAQVQALDGGRLTLSGELDTTVFVQVDQAVISQVDFALTSASTLELLAPQATALGSADVVAIGPSASSAAVAVEYVETSPPKVLSDSGNLVGSVWHVYQGTNQWTYGALVGKTAKVLLSTSSATTTVGGFQVLASAATVDEELLQDPGLATFTRDIPNGLAGTSLFMQVLLYDGPELIDVSAIVEHYVVF